jgi:hypothetical protein
MADNASVYGVVVAGIAVVVSAIAQYFTLRFSRQNTVTALRVNAVEASLTTLRSTLAEYLPILYSMKVEEANRLSRGPPMDGDKVDKLSGEEAKLFAVIQMSLDPTKDSHRQLLRDLEEMRRMIGVDGRWPDQTRGIITRVGEITKVERMEALGLGSDKRHFRFFNAIGRQAKN